MHDIFTAVGATNATWVWCPNIDPNNEFRDIAPIYPGDEYVDWTGLDGYNWGNAPYRPAGWHSFDQLYSSTYHRIIDTIAPSKPMMISEIGSTEYGGSKAAWIRTCWKRYRPHTRRSAACSGSTSTPTAPWTGRWRPRAARSAPLPTGIQSPAYASNQYASLPATDAIQPAS